MTKLVALLLISASFGTEPFEVSADRLEGSQTTGIYHAAGQVVLRRPGLVAYADRMSFYEKENLVKAEGNVIIIEDVTVTTCSRASFTVPELVGGLSGAKLQIKRGIAHLDLRKLSKSELRTAGENDLSITASRVDKVRKNEFSVSKGSFTPCHCEKDEAPSWHISTTSASVDLTSGALLKWPVFHIKEVPVMALPWFYLPLGERRSGLLLPKVAHTSVTGMLLEQPLYLTLGRSWDTTLGSKYFFDRGFSPEWELRWAPSKASNGWLRLSTLFDHGAYDAETKSWSPSADETNFRFSVAARHRQQWGRHRLGVEINASGDPSYIGEFADQYLQRQTEYTSSRASYSYNDNSNVRVSAGLSLTQDLRPQRYIGLDLRNTSLFSGERGPNEIGGPGNIRYRFADLRVDALPMPIIETGLPMYGEAVLRAQAFAAPWPVQPRFGRVDFRPNLIVPLSIGNLFALDTQLGARMTSWTGRASSESHAHNRWALISKSRLSTEFTGIFSSLIHRVRPELNHLLIPYVEGDGPGVFDTADELDLLSTAHQFKAGVYSDILDKKSGRRLYYLAGNVGRELGSDLGNEETWAPIHLKSGLSVPVFDKVTAKASGEGFWSMDDFSLEEILVSTGLRFGQVLNLSASWLKLGESVSRRTFVAPEEIIPSSTIDRTGYLSRDDYSAQLGLGNLAVLPWTAYQGLLFSAVFQPSQGLAISGGFALDIDQAGLENSDPNDLWSRLKQSSIGIRWDSPCKCWSASLMMTKARDRETPDVRFLIDLAHLGGMSY